MKSLNKECGLLVCPSDVAELEKISESKTIFLEDRKSSNLIWRGSSASHDAGPTSHNGGGSEKGRAHAGWNSMVTSCRDEGQAGGVKQAVVAVLAGAGGRSQKTRDCMVQPEHTASCGQRLLIKKG